MATLAPDAIRDEIVRFAHVGQDRHEYARAASQVLRRTVPFDAVTAVWFDPTTALPVDTWIDNSLTGSKGTNLAELDLQGAGLNNFWQLAASGKRAASLSQATGGNLDHSRRHRELLHPLGIGDELRAVSVGDSGMWGGIVMHRECGAPNFSGRDVNLLASLTGGCPEMQRTRFEQDLSVEASHRDRGLLLLDDEDDIAMADAAATAWLDELRRRRQRLPLVVTAVADRAREVASGRSDIAATARVQVASGRWVVVRGSVLSNGTHARTAVTLEPASAPELVELIADAYGLTARERRVTELVAQGLTSAAIAAQLFLSTYTVNDHLKAIFEKLDVSSRGELIARLFVDHHHVGGRQADTI